MTDHITPQTGDRLLVMYENCPPGGRTGYVRAGGFFYTDGGKVRKLTDVTVLQLLHRPISPRPEVTSFTRSDGRDVRWNNLIGGGGGPLQAWLAYTPEDARNFARLYAEGAAQLEYDITHGTKFQ